MTLGDVKLSLLTYCPSFGYTACVCYKWTQAGVFVLFMRVFVEFLEWARAKSSCLRLLSYKLTCCYLITHVLLRCNSVIVYIYTIPALETGTQGKPTLQVLLPSPLSPPTSYCLCHCHSWLRVEVPARDTAKRGRQFFLDRGWGGHPVGRALHPDGPAKQRD